MGKEGSSQPVLADSDETVLDLGRTSIEGKMLA